MKSNAIVLAALCGITAFAGENIPFETKPAQEKLTQEKPINSLRILPEKVKQDRFCRITMQVKMTEPGMIVSGIRRENEKPLWRQSENLDTEWRQYTLYVTPGEAWTCSLGARPKGNTFLIREIKIEALSEEDLTKNLLPPPRRPPRMPT